MPGVPPALPVALAALAATALLPAPAAASCERAVRWHGTLYLAAPAGLAAPAAGRALGAGAVPGCEDVVVVADGQVRPHREPDRPTRLWRVRGVAPAVAVRARDGLYVSAACSDALARRPATRLPARCGLGPPPGA